MATTCTVPSSLLPRLLRLHLAADAIATGVLSHIHLRVSADQVRFAATNGRLLSVLRSPVGQFTGPEREVVLDTRQLIQALRTIDQALPARSTEPILLQIDGTEARVAIATAAGVVRLIPGPFPSFDHVFARTSAQQWVPSLCALAPDLIAIAQRLAGTQPVLFSSPVPPGTGLGALWGTDAPEAPIPWALLQTLVKAPAYWADTELALLLMPITRGAAESQLDLAGFIATPASARLATAA